MAEDSIAGWLRGLGGAPVRPRSLSPALPAPEPMPEDAAELAAAFYRPLQGSLRALPEGPGMAELAGSVSAWLDFSRARLCGLFEQLSPRDRITFALIPSLLNFNARGLPGYSQGIDATHGIRRFDFNTLFTHAMVEHFPGRLESLLPASKPAIRGLFAVGRAGTIGAGEERAVDFWVVLDELDLSAAEQAELLDRIESIESWAAKRELALRFFLVDTERAREHDFGGGDDNEARGRLLEEEFYRMAIYVAGELPVWWVTPLGLDAEGHRRVVRAVHDSDRLPPQLGFVDMGFVEPLPKGEHLTAALWRINHLLPGPFECLLEMALLLRDLEAERPQLLCDTLKATIFEGDAELTDPYVVHFDAITRYFSEQGDWAAYRTVQNCFYLKVGLGLSRERVDRGRFMRRFGLMRDYIARWGWEADLLSEVEALERWVPERVEAVGQGIRRLMLGMFRQINALGKAHPEAADELTILGRRLFACFGHEDGKLRHLFMWFLREPTREDRLLILERAEGPRWEVHRDARRDGVSNRGAPIYAADTLTEVAAWLGFNGLFRQDTAIGLVPRGSSADSEQFRDLLRNFGEVFGSPDPFRVPPEDFLERRRVTRSAILVDFEAATAAQGGMVVLPDNWDLLNYGRQRINRARDVSLVLLDSWGELLCVRYTGEHALPSALRGLYLRVDLAHPPEVPALMSSEDRMVPAVRNRIGALLKHCDQVIYGDERSPPARAFVYEIGARYQIVRHQPEGRALVGARGMRGVVRLLGGSFPEQQSARVDPLAPSLRDLRSLLERHGSDRDAAHYVAWRSDAKMGVILVCDSLGRIYRRVTRPKRLQATLLKIVRRVVHQLRDRVGSAQELHRALRVFELRGGQALGQRPQLVENTGHVLGELAQPRDGREELWLYGRLPEGRAGLGFSLGARRFHPQTQGRGFVSAALTELLRVRGTAGGDTLDIDASVVDFGPGRGEGIVQHLRLIDIYEGHLARALSALREPRELYRTPRGFNRREALP